MIIWLMIVTISKISVFGVVYWFADEFISLGILLLAPISRSPKVELVFVMMIMPFILNSF